MANDRQNKMWMLGESLKYMDENDLQVVEPEVIAHIMDTFIPIDDVSNVLVAEFIRDISSEVSNVQV